MDTLTFANQVLEHLTEQHDRKVQSLSTDAGKDPLEDRKKCGYIEATRHTIQTIKTILEDDERFQS